MNVADCPELPAQSASIAFFVAGLALLLYSRFEKPPSSPAEDVDLDTPILSWKSASLAPSDTPLGVVGKLRKLTSIKVRRTWLVLALGICTLAVRVEILRRLLKHSGTAISVGVVSAV